MYKRQVLSEAAQVPLVMHGGSGVSHEDYKRVIKNGVRKINYFTYMDKAGGEGINAIYPIQYYHEALRLSLIHILSRKELLTQ